MGYHEQQGGEMGCCTKERASLSFRRQRSGLISPHLTVAARDSRLTRGLLVGEPNGRSTIDPN